MRRRASSVAEHRGARHLGGDRARADAVDADAVRRECQRHHLGELVHAALAHRVGHLVGDREHGVHRRHVDDRAAHADSRPCAARPPVRKEHRLQVHREDAVEVGLVEVEEVAGVGDAGIVDEDVDAAGVRGGSLDDAGDVRPARDVGDDGRRAGHAGGSRGQFRLGDVGHDDRRAFVGEALRDGEADAARGPGDDGDPAFQSLHAGTPIQSMIRSARAITPAGTVMPMRCAAFRLSTRSKRDGCSTGNSAGLAPRRMRST